MGSAWTNKVKDKSETAMISMAVGGTVVVVVLLILFYMYVKNK
jgi:hypothetical protein